MTDEQIEQAAIERGCIKGTAEYYGFIQGARYAYQNPISPWRDAKKDKPKDNKTVLVSFHGIICNGEYDMDDGIWFASGWGTVEPEFWIPEPELPKGGEV